MGRPREGTARFGLFLAVWLLLIAAGVIWAVRSSGSSLRDLGALLGFPAPTVVLLLALCLGLYLSDVERYRLFGRALGVVVTRRAGFDAAVANVFFSWTTPGAAFGMPAAIVMLRRHGVPWDVATLISFGKSMTSAAFLLAAAFAVLAAGLGPGSSGEIRLVLTIGAGVVAAWLAIPLVGALFPRRALALIDRLGRGGRLAAGLRDGVERLAGLRAAGAPLLAGLAVAHAVYFVLLIGIGVVLALALGAESWPRAAGVSTVFVAFSYVAPTPGGAGLSEAAAVPFYGAILPPAEAVVLVLLYRALTFYLQIAVGALYLPFAGGIGDIVARRWPKGPA